MSTKDIKVNVECKLRVDDDTKEKLNSFYKALNELPKDLMFDIGVDGNFNTITPFRINLKDFILGSVKKHFEILPFEMPLLNSNKNNY